MWNLISVGELEQWLREKKQMLLLDVRNREDYEEAHIEEAVNLPTDEIERWKPEHWKLDIEIVCICYRGPNSIQAAKLLDHSGNHVSAVCGGMEAWGQKKTAKSEENKPETEEELGNRD